MKIAIELNIKNKKDVNRQDWHYIQKLLKYAIRKMEFTKGFAITTPDGDTIGNVEIIE
tara:strand:- start:373 stop:546 length:174 start_codon:yes stop_codon:yes gene_type:complete